MALIITLALLVFWDGWLGGLTGGSVTVSIGGYYPIIEDFLGLPELEEMEIIGALLGALGFAPITIKSLCCYADIVPATSFGIIKVKKYNDLCPKGHKYRQYVYGIEYIANNRGR